MRKKRSRFNRTKSEVIILDGGLNENVSSLELKPGELIKCVNYQHVLGSQGGYKSIAGYERFDGQTKPSAIGASEGDSLDREIARAKIGPVPGSGPIRGIYVFRGVLFAFRDNTEGTLGKMWRSSNRGWQEVDTSSVQLAPGGSYSFFEYNFYGGVTGTSPSSTPSASVSTSPSPSSSPSDSPSEGTPSGTPSSSTSATPSEGTPSSSPSASPSATPSDSPSDSPSGTGEVSEASSPSSSPSAGTPSETPSDSPSSTPSSSASASPDMEITSLNLFFTNGVNEACRFDGKYVYKIYTGMGSEDKPINVVVHNERLFLAFTGGSLQYSSAGEPNDWVSNAGEIGIGREITNLSLGVGNALIIFCRNSIKILKGTSPDDWVIETFSDSSGAYENTAKRLLGTLFFMDDRGVTSLEAVDAFGDFKANSLSEKVYNTIQQNKSLVTCSTVSRDLNQYRLFFSNNYGLYFSFKEKKLRGVTLVKFPIPVTRTFEGEDANGNNVIFFVSGTTGLVYQLDSGTSFDGTEIETRLSTAYYHYKSPRSWKKFKSLTFEISTLFDMTLTIHPDFDYGDANIPRAGSFLKALSGTGDVWGEEEWGTLVYTEGNEETNRVRYYVLGMGTNMNVSIITSSKFNLQHTVQNFIVDYEEVGRQY